MFSKNTKTFLFLAVILLVSAFIRFYQLGNVPNGLTVDEADMGYNAYSILKTGKDVYNRSFPLFFQSLDDYKPGFAIYSSIPAIYIFGNTDFAIRLFPTIVGLLTPILLFFVLRLLYPKNQDLALTSAVLMAFAPWNIAISRATLMYIELIFFYLLFLITFLIGIRKNNGWLILSSIPLSLTLYVYYAAVIYLPFILILLFFLHKKELLKNFKITLLSFIILAVVALPAIVHYSSPKSKSRLNSISVLTADITLPTSLAEIEQDKREGQPFSQIIHNRRFVYASALLDNYFDYFNPDYLFVNAKNIRYFYVNNVGLFYLLELPFVLYGLYVLIKRRDKPDLLILALLVIGPIPAAITLGSPFPHRGILTILAIQLITAIGVASFIELLKKNKFRYIKQVLTIVIVLYTTSIYFFLHQYFIHLPREFTSENDNGAWFSTVRDVIPLVNSKKTQYDKVIFTWSQGKLVPMVYFLFYSQKSSAYNKIDPRILQTKAALWTNEPPSYKQIYNQVGNIEFRPINWDQDKNFKNTLFIGYPDEFPEDIGGVIEKTYLPNGKPHFLLVTPQ